MVVATPTAEHTVERNRPFGAGSEDVPGDLLELPLGLFPAILEVVLLVLVRTLRIAVICAVPEAVQGDHPGALRRP